MERGQHNSSMLSNEHKKQYGTALSHYVDTFGETGPLPDKMTSQGKGTISYVNSNSVDSNFKNKKLERKGDSINIQIDNDNPASNDQFTNFLRRKIKQTIDSRDPNTDFLVE